MRPPSTDDLPQLLLAVVLPPLQVYLTDDFGRPFWINVGLTFLGYVPGLAHALWRILDRA